MHLTRRQTVHHAGIFWFRRYFGVGFLKPLGKFTLLSAIRRILTIIYHFINEKQAQHFDATPQSALFIKVIVNRQFNLSFDDVIMQTFITLTNVHYFTITKLDAIIAVIDRLDIVAGIDRTPCLRLQVITRKGLDDLALQAILVTRIHLYLGE